MSDTDQRNEPEVGEPQATIGPRRPDLSQSDDAEPARILILEDSPWDAELAQRLLTSAGVSFTALVVDNGESFVKQLTDFGADVIISDFSIRGFSGAEALRVVQEHRPDIPFICWSGTLGDEAAVDLIKGGATDYVLKDRPARLPSAVSRAIAESRQRSRLAQIEGQLGQARRLASLGRLRGAEQALSLTHQMLATVRREATAPDPAP
jgi:DNA-binding NtrC family response regulator